MPESSSEITLSAIIPCYNSAATLRQALESIPDLGRYEVIVSDDASQDPATLQLLDQLEQTSPFQRARLRLVRNEENGGIAKALMTGAHRMSPSARYLIELDSDDMFFPSALQKMESFLEDRPDLDLAWGDLRVEGDRSYLRAFGPRFDHWLIIHKNHLPVSSLIRRDAWERAGGWRVSREGYQDWGMWLALAEIGSQGEHVGCPIIRYSQAQSGHFMANKAKVADRQQATLAHFPELVTSEEHLPESTTTPAALRMALSLSRRLPLGYRKSRLDALFLALFWARNLDTTRGRLSELFA